VCLCSHFFRLAPLSEGRIESDGTLQCSYHGWRFNSEGKCTEIPQVRTPSMCWHSICWYAWIGGSCMLVQQLLQGSTDAE
jgi:nitrite reductase/ring-hydroxylating ferredoxin subunit